MGRDVDTNLIHRNIQHRQQEREPNTISKTTEKTFQGLCEVEYSVNRLVRAMITLKLSSPSTMKNALKGPSIRELLEPSLSQTRPKDSLLLSSRNQTSARLSGVEQLTSQS